MFVFFSHYFPMCYQELDWILIKEKKKKVCLGCLGLKYDHSETWYNLGKSTFCGRPLHFLRINNFSFYPKNNEIEQSFFQFAYFPQLAWHIGHFHYHFIASFGHWKVWVWDGNNPFTAVCCREQEGSDHQELRKQICYQGFNSHPRGDGRKQTWRWVSSSPAPTAPSGTFWLLINQSGSRAIWCSLHTHTHSPCLSSLYQAITNLKVLPAALLLKEKLGTQRIFFLPYLVTWCTQTRWRIHQKTQRPTFPLIVSVHTSTCSSQEFFSRN